jgi:hypothetical protein
VEPNNRNEKGLKRDHLFKNERHPGARAPHVFVHSYSAQIIYVLLLALLAIISSVLLRIIKTTNPNERVDCCDVEYYTWAYLNEDYVPVLCTQKRANQWYRSEDEARSLIKEESINGWTIWTNFLRFSDVPDGPPGFWNVGYRPEEIVDSLRGGGRSFLTKEAALEFHAKVAGRIRARGYPRGREFSETKIHDLIFAARMRSGYKPVDRLLRGG